MKVYSGERRTLDVLLEDTADRFGDRTLLLYQDEQVSYREFYERSCRVAGGLEALGIGKGDHVAILMDNHPNFLYTWFGLSLLGAVEVPVNTNLKNEALHHVLADSEAKVLVVDESYVPLVLPFVDALPSVSHLVIHSEQGLTTIPPGLRWGVNDFSQLIAHEPEFSRSLLKPDDLMGIMYTSGTTGPAKGVMLSHSYAFHFGEQKVRHMRTSDSDIIYNCFPMWNATGQFETTMPALLAGGAVAHAKKFSASRFWDDIRKYGCTEFVYMGGILTILWKQPPKPDDADNPVRCAYGVPTPKDIHRPFEERFGLKLIEVYGSTEVTAVTYNTYDEPRVGSCGKATSGFDVQIVNDHREPIPNGEIGEFAVRPHRPGQMMSGYYKRPDAMAAAMQDGWFYTGDLGYQDDDGYFYFVGRKSHAIRRKGFMISPAEVEQIIHRHAAVFEAAVVGLPGELGEEEIKLCVQLVDGACLSEEELYRYCVDNLPKYAVPRYIEFKAGFERTGTDRIKKFVLVEEGVTPHTWDAVRAGLAKY